MTVGRDPEDLRKSAAAGEARVRGWASRFPSAMVLSAAAAIVALALPFAVNLAAGQEVAGPRASRSGHPGASADVRTAAAPTAPKSGSTKPAPGAPRSKPAETTVSAPAGDTYWVQIGAFRDAETARRIAQRLREQKYRVHESTVSVRPTGASERATAGAGATATRDRDRYEVVVTSASPSEVSATLTGKGLTSRTTTEGAVITPGLPLGEAVALSQDLTRDGLAVRVQRVEAAAPAAPQAQGRGEDVVLHRVRVGSFTDRAAAEAALKELDARGYDPVLTRGSE